MQILASANINFSKEDIEFGRSYLKDKRYNKQIKRYFKNKSQEQPPNKTVPSTPTPVLIGTVKELCLGVFWTQKKSKS